TSQAGPSSAAAGTHSEPTRAAPDVVRASRPQVYKPPHGWVAPSAKSTHRAARRVAAIEETDIERQPQMLILVQRLAYFGVCLLFADVASRSSAERQLRPIVHGLATFPQAPTAQPRPRKYPSGANSFMCGSTAAIFRLRA